jgi:adenylate cyclase
MAASVWGSFFNDSNEDLAQLSPQFGRPGSARDDIMGFNDARRPSAASNVSMSSSGSKSSVSRNGGPGYHKKRLQNVLGEEFTVDSRQNSDTSLVTPYVVDTQSIPSTRNRNNSVNTNLGSGFHSRPSSPVGSRPRTPLPSSEVTPWEFEDSSQKVSEWGD